MMSFRVGPEGELRLKVYNAAYTMAFILAKHSPKGLRMLRLIYLLLVGSVSCPGILGSFAGYWRYGSVRREAAVLLRTWGAVISGWRAGSSLPSQPGHSRAVEVQWADADQSRLAS